MKKRRTKKPPKNALWCVVWASHHIWLESNFVGHKYSLVANRLPFLNSSSISITSSLQMYSSRVVFFRLCVLFVPVIVLLLLLPYVDYVFALTRKLSMHWLNNVFCCVVLYYCWENEFETTHSQINTQMTRFLISVTRFCWPCFKAYGIFDLHWDREPSQPANQLASHTQSKRNVLLILSFTVSFALENADAAVMFCFVLFCSPFSPLAFFSVSLSLLLSFLCRRSVFSQRIFDLSLSIIEKRFSS